MPKEDMLRVLYLGRPEHTSDCIRRRYAQNLDIDILNVATRAELLESLPSFVAEHGPYTALVCRLGTQPFEPFDGHLLAPLMPHLRIVVSAQRGYDDFDLEWMTANGVWFCNTRNATGESTANMALFLLPAILRDSTRAESNFRHGHWRASLGLGRDPAGLTIGIVGMGTIGMSLAHKASGLGMKVAYYVRKGRSVDGAPTGSLSCETLEHLLHTTDILSLHCPLNDLTKHLIGKKELEAMKDGSYIINTSRGAVIDNAALSAALESGKIRRAGLDVFENEPNDINSYFLRSEKVIVQPHMGGLTEESFERAEDECLQNIISYQEKGIPRSPVNDLAILVRNDSPMQDVESESAREMVST